MGRGINLAIIGYGYMGEIYKNACFELYNRNNRESYYKYNLSIILNDFRLKVIVDPNFTDSYYDDNLDLWYVQSVDEMLLKDELHINTAVIASPINTHFSIAEKLIRNRISLLVEKPVCKTANEISILRKLARKHWVKIMPGHIERYNPVTLEAKEIIDNRVYGSAKSYLLKRTSEKPERVKENLLIDKLVHDLDLATYMFGRYKIVDISIKRIKGEIMECNIITQHRNGVKGSIISSWIIKEKVRKMVVDFDRGRFCGDLIDKSVKIDRFLESSKIITPYKNNQIKDQLVDFLALYYQKIKTLVNIFDAYKVALLIDSVVERTVNEE